MRMQLTTLAVLFSGLASAGSTVTARVDGYSDEWVDVVAPAVQGTWETEELRVEGKYVVDIISGATPVMTADLITSATTFAEVRHQGGLGIGWRPRPETLLSGRYGISSEPDFFSQALGVKVAQDLFERMSTLTVGYEARVERVGVVTDPTFAQWGHNHRIDLSWAQILGRRTTATVLGTAAASVCGEALGCLASPYRYVPLLSAGGISTTLPERNPDRLYRGSLGLEMSQAIGPSTALHGGYRFYGDSWKVIGHTGTVRIEQSIAQDQLILGVKGRIAHQSPSSFHRTQYEVSDPYEPTVPAYRTGDRELSGLFSGMVAGRVAWNLFDAGPFVNVGLDARLGHLWFRYPRFPALPQREAWLWGGGFHGAF